MLEKFRYYMLNVRERVMHRDSNLRIVRGEPIVRDLYGFYLNIMK